MNEISSSKLTQAIIGIIVAVMVLGIVLVPVLSQATETEKTFENTGYYYMDKIASNDADAYTIKWDATDAGTLIVNGKDIHVGDWGTTYGMTLTIFATETDIFRVGPAPGVQTLSWIQLRGSTINYAQASSSFDATIQEGNISVQLDAEPTPRTLTYTEAYMISADKSDYVMKKMNESVYMLPDSPIFSMGYSVISNGSGNDNVVLSVSGTIEGVEVDVIRSSGVNPITFSDFNISTTPVSNYVDLVKFDKITFVATDNGADTDMTYSYVVVPAEITAELTEHPTPMMITLINIIPVFVVLAIILGVCGLFYYRKNENSLI